MSYPRRFQMRGLSKLHLLAFGHDHLNKFLKIYLRLSVMACDSLRCSNKLISWLKCDALAALCNPSWCHGLVSGHYVHACNVSLVSSYSPVEIWEYTAWIGLFGSICHSTYGWGYHSRLYGVPFQNTVWYTIRALCMGTFFSLDIVE